MSILSDLVAQIEDANLRDRISKEVNKLAKQKKFGLVFEEHQPECTPLYEIPVKVNARVAKKDIQITDVYTVTKIEDGVAECVHRDTKEVSSIPVEDLVTIAEFGEPIYPYLKPLDSVCNAPDSDLWHTLIEADNYHALQLLEYLYAGKVDCIYIDPPYNTGAKDWKYNNDYVDGVDQYRHSKWLSFMKKRLLLAKKLLNPKDSVLIVTIDEKEYLHLGCLLEELFPEARMQMVSNVIKRGGSQRTGEFARADEYLFFVQIGSSSVAPEKVSDEIVPVLWRHLHRNGAAGHREARPNMFYPIYVNEKTKKIEKFGEPIPLGVSRFTAPKLDGCIAVFPIVDDGTEMRWGLSRETALIAYEKGCLRIGDYKPNKPQQFVVSYLSSGVIEDIESGKARVVGYEEDGSVIAQYETGKYKMPTTAWDYPSHDANTNGTKLLNNIIGERFSYPKSLYAVHDSIKHFVINKSNALILDFFAGSGTTLHAVNLLNAKDNGNRRCIIVTNNEVSVEESKALSSKGFKPGDKEWNDLGIARYVTWPRTVCTIEGKDIKGNSLKGDYLGADKPMADGFKANAAFFQLGFLDKNAVALGRQFKELLPVLWMKAGAVGKCPVVENEIPAYMVCPENKMAILIDERYYMDFVMELESQEDIKTVFIVTDSEAGYRSMIKGLNVENTYQLYKDYLDNFRINSVRR